MAFWFLSRRSHEEVLAGKEEVIQSLRDQINMLTAMRAADADDRNTLNARILELVEKSMTPPEPPAKRLRQEAEPAQPSTLDLAMVDPNDTDTIAQLVAREIPRGARVNGVALAQRVEHMRQQVREAREARTRRAMTPMSSDAVNAAIHTAELQGKALAAQE